MAANHLYLLPTLRVIQALTEQFLIERPQFDPATGLASFRYSLDGLSFTETLGLPAGANTGAAETAALHVLTVLFLAIFARFPLAAIQKLLRHG